MIMSKQVKLVELVPPSYKNNKELVVSKEHTCGYCHGNGWFWGRDESGDSVKNPCPICEGSGMVDAVITIDWKPSKK